MAIPPFSIAETVPQNSDVVLNYPALERTYRDVVESWLNIITDPATGLLKASGFPTTLSIPGTTFTVGGLTAGASTLTSLLAAGRPFTQQLITVSGNPWTKPAGCIRAIFEATGGGAAGGNVDGQAGATGGAGGGGGSGGYGMTLILDVSAEVAPIVTIGAGGLTSGSASGNGGSGGNTTITIGGVTYTWSGGLGGGGMVASSGYGSQDGGQGGQCFNLLGGGEPGGMGVWAGTDTNATGGNGGSNPFGTGGKGPHIFSATAVSGAAGFGNGSGGAGGCVSNSASNPSGAAGKIGIMRVWEMY